MQSIDNLSLLLGTEATLLKKKKKENIRSRVRRTRFEGFTKFTCSFLRLSTYLQVDLITNKTSL